MVETVRGSGYRFTEISSVANTANTATTAAS